MVIRLSSVDAPQALFLLPELVADRFPDRLASDGDAGHFLPCCRCGSRADLQALPRVDVQIYLCRAAIRGVQRAEKLSGSGVAHVPVALASTVGNS
jgi:hypothetical protein